MQQSRLVFHEEIRKNKFYSILMISIVFIVLIALGYVIALAIGGDYFFFILILAIIISISYIVVSYYKSDKIAVASVNAKRVHADNPDYRQYHHLVEGIALASGLPKPKLYIMESPQINAFASGRDPDHAVICFTTGALEKLDKTELEGVIAHELSHVANYDIRFMTLTAVLVGMIAIISQIFLRSLFFRSIGGGNRKDNSNAVFMVIGIALAILAPIIVALVQLAISRKREYNADASAVKFMRTPTGLIHALQKIKNNQEMKVAGAVAPLFIAQPTKQKEIFMTHPPLDKRIDRLRRM
ncbi:zinc metalloprotease HtpX [Candidatus Pacearchaeota archaeon]|nr:zinc metalloprotease HtpX [Candidatus Pacearchaeota archaeon]|tara:strand:- start:11899 stop:12795 length:897 start_codon:yes stop_codon:yes gene_type:complete